MAPHDQDPYRLDVSLNIMSDATLTAVNNLANQLAGLRELIASQGVSDPGARAEGVGRAAEYVRTRVQYTPGTVPNRPPGPPGTGPSTNPTDGSEKSRDRAKQLRAEYEAYMADIEARAGGRKERPQAGPERPLSPDAAAMMSRQMSDMQRWSFAGKQKKVMGGSRFDNFFAMYPGVSRDPYEDRSYDFEAGAGPGEAAIPTSGGISGGGSYPPQGPPTTNPMGGMGDMPPGWAQALARDGISPDSRFGMTIPRLGEFTIQDKLGMAAQWMGRAAMRAQQDGNATVGGIPTEAMGRMAAGSAYMRDQSAGIVAIGREFERLRGFARGQELSGEDLGFSRTSSLGDASLFGVGMRLNLGFTSDAQREALHQEITQRRVQAAAGVSGEEAQRIRQTVAGMGFSGNTNERLQMDLFRNLQQQGISPESVAPLVDQGVRQGNMSISSLRDTMIELARAARSANMTLQETTSAALEYSESVQAIGANYEASLKNAATFTASGLDPRIVGQAMQSPMMQGVLGMQTGIAPQMQGVIGAPGVAQGMAETIRMSLGMGEQFLNQPDQYVTSASGQRIKVASGKDQQIAFASETSGIPRQIIERYMRNPNFLTTAPIAASMAQTMQDQVRAETHRERTKDIIVPTDGPAGAGLNPAARRLRHEKVVEGYNVSLTDAQRQALEHGSTGDNKVQYDELERQMIEMDPKNHQWTDRVRKIRKDHANVEDRLGVAQRIIGEAANAKPEPDYILGLTDEAAKALKIVKPKDRTGALPRANAGGAPANGAYGGPNFPSSSSGALQYRGGP